MKILKIISIIVFLLLFSNIALATTSYGEFQNNQQSIIINDGDQIYFNFGIFSINPPVNYDIKMYDYNTNLIKTFVESSSNDNLISGRYYITQQDYTDNNRYSIVIKGYDNYNDPSSTILNLQVGRGFNDAPILNPIGNKQVNENELLQFTVTANDPNDDSITLTAVNLPQGATFANNEFSWTPNLNQAGSYTVRFSVSDGSLIDFEDVVINVADVIQNNIPTVNIISPAQNELISGIYDITWSATDLDQAQNTLDIRVEYTYDGYSWFVLEDSQDNNDGIFTWDTRRLSNANDYRIRISATDDNGDFGTSVVTFTLNNPSAPNINIIAPTENEVISGIYDITWSATDLDQAQNTLDIRVEYNSLIIPPNNLFNRILSLFKINKAAAWVILEDLQDNNDGIFTWDTTQVQNGDYQLRIIATDNDGNTATGFINSFIIFNRIIQNNNPVITSSPVLNGFVGKVYQYDVEAVDLDNDRLFYSLLNYPAGMSIDNNNGLISWTPNSEGYYNVIVQVSDNKGGLAQQSFTITISKEDLLNKGKVFETRDFMISNIILKQNNDNLNILVNLKNFHEKDDVKISVTDLNSGKIMNDYFTLDASEGIWRVIRLNDLEKGRHVVKVEAFSKAFKDTRYGFVYIS